MLVHLCFLLFLFPLAQADRWNYVKDVIDKQSLFQDVCVQVGREQVDFTYCIGNTTMNTTLETASSSKMVGGLAMFEAVMKEKVRLHDKVNKYLDYWTKNESDPRSTLTIHHLVSFQSGYDTGMDCTKNDTLAKCVKRHYETTPISEVPGTFWDYNEVHLQILGAVMEVIYQQPIQDILKDGLVRYGMNSSHWMGGENPYLAGSLVTTGADYGEFLKRYFNGNIIPYGWRSQIETEYNIFPEVKWTKKSEILELFVGSYGYLTWWECAVMIKFPKYMRNECYIADTHSDPGIFGFWPLFDRKNNYWMVIAVQGKPVEGCVLGQGFRDAIKPFVNFAMNSLLPPPQALDFDEMNDRVSELLSNEELREGLKRMATPNFHARLGM